ncbi:helix-turn-helix domain-containing protein [Acutalibacter muris]|jgi:AcrR family transcriptional regulator|nr:helix-turn-helix domain-containing protein [Acutalibacter muris]MCI9544589.1 helix-turn-helix domain-containing protein [Acutalibacter muris]
MRMNTEEKKLIARYHAGESIAEICAETGVARATFYS